MMATSNAVRDRMGWLKKAPRPMESAAKFTRGPIALFFRIATRRATYPRHALAGLVGSCQGFAISRQHGRRSGNGADRIVWRAEEGPAVLARAKNRPSPRSGVGTVPSGRRNPNAPCRLWSDISWTRGWRRRSLKLPGAVAVPRGSAAISFPMLSAVTFEGNRGLDLAEQGVDKHRSRPERFAPQRDPGLVSQLADSALRGGRFLPTPRRRFRLRLAVRMRATGDAHGLHGSPARSARHRSQRSAPSPVAARAREH